MVLHEHGKRLPTLLEYAAMLMPADWPNDNETLHHSGVVSSGREDEFCLVQTSEKGYRMMPGPEFCPRLYRGQTEDHSPCRPGLYRSLSDADMLYWTAKAVELGDLVMRHPAAKDMVKWDFDGLKYKAKVSRISSRRQAQ